MSVQPDTRRRLGRAAAVVAAAATITGTWGLATAASTATADERVRPEPTATAARPDPTATAVAPEANPGTRFARTELYFGTDRKDDPDVSEAQFNRFVDRIVTSRFPDGLTQIRADGQFRGTGGIVEEKSFVIILLYPLDDSSANREIEDIRRAYKVMFDQESVLRADSVDQISF
jgi:Protein of unknown function (DUF3574)